MILSRAFFYSRRARSDDAGDSVDVKAPCFEGAGSTSTSASSASFSCSSLLTLRVPFPDHLVLGSGAGVICALRGELGLCHLRVAAVRAVLCLIYNNVQFYYTYTVSTMQLCFCNRRSPFGSRGGALGCYDQLLCFA